MPYLLHCFLLLSQNQNSLLFFFFFFFFPPSVCLFQLVLFLVPAIISIFYKEMTKMPRNGTKRFSVCDVSRCLIENFHTEHNNFKSILLILLLQNYKKPLEQEEEKQK